MLRELHARLDPETQELILPGGRRIPGIVINGQFQPPIGGGSATLHDEIPGGGGGGSGMDMDLDSDDDDDASGGDDDNPRGGDDDDDEWTPPTREEWARLKSAIKGERRERKKDKRAFEEQIKNMATSGTAAAVVEIEQARIDEREKIEKKWSKRAIRAEASALFAAQGASATNAERLARMVDLDKVSYDERDEEFDGLEEEVEDIMSENPEFFRKPKSDDEDGSGRTTRVAKPRVEAATRGSRGGTGGGKSRQSSAEKLAARALGRQPRRQ